VVFDDGSSVWFDFGGRETLSCAIVPRAYWLKIRAEDIDSVTALYPWEIGPLNADGIRFRYRDPDDISNINNLG
jgi:hypothetical protein